MMAPLMPRPLAAAFTVCATNPPDAPESLRKKAKGKVDEFSHFFENCNGNPYGSSA
jgi:hypothetical protein